MNNLLINIVEKFDTSGRNIACGAPEGVDARVLADLAAAAGERDVVVVLRDAERARRIADALAFFAPDTTVLSFPAWDCLP